ncbi:hypothetical protein OZK63_42060, partial [Streptomyces sp. UMAF16]|nr:hypothetical protein [Streptomyces sp. UMAF16]
FVHAPMAIFIKKTFNQIIAMLQQFILPRYFRHFKTFTEMIGNFKVKNTKQPGFGLAFALKCME